MAASSQSQEPEVPLSCLVLHIKDGLNFQLHVIIIFFLYLSLFFFSICKLQKSKRERAALPSLFPADFIPPIKVKISRAGLCNREGLTQSRLFVCRHNWGEDSLGNNAA